jgi:hypothetical protein
MNLARWNPESRWNLHSLSDVALLKIPPYRWMGCVPLVRFSLGVEQRKGYWLIMCGWWGWRTKNVVTE